MDVQQAPPQAAWIAIPLVLLVLFFRLRRASSDQALRIERLWITPALLLIVAGLVLFQSPLSGFDWAWLVPAFAVGGAAGFWRGRFTLVTIDPATHALTSRTSPLGMYLLVAILALRIGLRLLLTAEASSLHLNAALITDAFLVFAVGLVALQRIEVWIRASKLLADARAAGAAADLP
jgi:Protein of unknown function (DUF1453)